MNDNAHESKVSPRKPGGFQDYLPDRMIARQAILATIRDVYERFGFVPLQTSTVEYFEVLTGGKPTAMRIYRLAERFIDQEDERQNQKGLRFDLTVPLARVVAANWDELPHPFKRYQLGNVFRGEKPQAGRFNEFAQFDVDIVGAQAMFADAEIVTMIHVAMQALGVKRFRIRINNRKILNALPAYAGFAEEAAPDVFRILDKVDKLGIDGVEKELTASGLIQEAEGETEQGLGLTPAVAQKLRAFIEIRAESNGEMLAKLNAMLGHVPIAAEGLAELEEILALTAAIGLDRIVIDPSVARGLGYYTGPVFETTLDDLPSIGSVCSGGRYDGLVTTFSEMKAPAVGTSIGVDRFVDAMVKLGTLEATRATAQVLITRFTPTLDAHYLSLATKLREAGIKTDVYYGDEPAFKAQMAYAVKQEIPVVVIVGPDEQSAGVVSVKDMTHRTQEKVPIDDLVGHVQKILGLPS